MYAWTQEWLKDVQLEEVVFSYDKNKDGKISLEELDILVCTCSLYLGMQGTYRVHVCAC